MPTLYKICPAALWREAERPAVSAAPRSTCRTASSISPPPSRRAETAARHFAGERDLVLVRVDAARLGAALKWEPSRGGALFPHLYGELDLAAVTASAPLPLGRRPPRVPAARSWSAGETPGASGAEPNPLKVMVYQRQMVVTEMSMSRQTGVSSTLQPIVTPPSR